MLNKIITNITSRPGIYQFLNDKSNIIYIGKAANLKKRIASYFNKTSNTIKTTKLVENIADIQIIITKNEEEALILENTLIKKHKPKYNILLRDDKSYPYIYIDTTHKYPSIKFYRGLKHNKKGFYFGPYTQVNHVRYMLNLIEKIFHVRSCDDSYFSNRTQPCLQFQLKRCDAPCVDYISAKDYKIAINNSILFLQGKNDALVKQFSDLMMQYSEQKKYEDASLVRDKIAMIRSLTQSKNLINNERNLDIITLSSSKNLTCLDVYLVREGINLGNKTFEFTNDSYTNTSLLNSFLKQYYLNNIPPDKIIVSSKSDDSSLLSNLLFKKYKKKIKIIHATRKPYSTWLQICQINCDERLNLLLSTKNKNDIFSSLNQDLKYQKTIKTAICFDVSHLSGSNMQGAAVWFNFCGPDKKLYRRYNLNNVNKHDDYEAMKTIFKRRLSKLREEDNIPDLIIVDGGKGQITQGKNILKELGIVDALLLGVVKGPKRLSRNDRILDINFHDITLTLTHESIKLLQLIRNEAHRFAITGQRQKSLNKQFESKLDKIPGIGKTRKLGLLKYYGGIQGVLKSSLEDLLKVPGINLRLADIIYKHLHNK